MIPPAMRRELPSGFVTFLFTDVEGSTKLLQELGAQAYAAALAEHRRLIREACAAHGGVEVDTQGDAFFFAFPTAPGALAAGRQMTEVLAPGPIQVRIGLHTGAPLVTDEGYVGDDVHFAARVAASGHGGQILLSTATAALIEPSGSEPQALALLDLGEHRLKDIPNAVAIFQLGDGSFPPLKTISNTNLPRPASSFVGRERELEEVLAHVQRGARLVALTGPGGSGKTRLAIEAGASLVPEYKAGVFWVGLAALRDPALVTETISQTLGAKDGLADHIGEREMLLLLDNLEQVIEAAPELSALLRACPNLTLLVTSRELLRVQGEVEYPVPPLAEPEAVSLFCERAQVEPSEEIVELCTRLDNLPLAVELAAARTRALSPAQILERLSQRLDLFKGGRDADPRQQTLRATIEWSYDLLSDQEQQLFRRLSVFAGGCTLEAAEEVCDAGLDTLQSLVEKSLLRFTVSEAGSRYWMLETIREFAGERLETSDKPEEQRRRHAEWFSQFCERRLGRLGDGVPIEPVLPEVAAEQDNLRTALSWCWTSDRNELGLRLGAAATGYWCARGQFTDAAAWLAEATPRIATATEELQLEALKAATMLEAWLHGDAEASGRYAERALMLADGFGTRRDILWLTQARAGILWESGELDAARVLFKRSLAGYRELGDRVGEANELHHLGELQRDARNFGSAEEFLGAAVALYRELGEPVGLSHTLHGLGDLALDRDDLETAASCYREALEIAQEPRGQNYCLAGLASVFARTGRSAEAATLWGAVAGTEEHLGIRMFATERGRYEKDLDSLQETPEWAAGRELQLDDAVSLAQRYLD